MIIIMNINMSNTRPSGKNMVFTKLPGGTPQTLAPLKIGKRAHESNQRLTAPLNLLNVSESNTEQWGSFRILTCDVRHLKLIWMSCSSSTSMLIMIIAWQGNTHHTDSALNRCELCAIYTPSNALTVNQRHKAPILTKYSD